MIDQAQLLGSLQRIQMIHQSGRTAEAWQAIAPLRAAIGDHGQALRLYALVAQSAGQIDPAVEALRRIIAVEREPPEIVGALADMLGTAGRHEEALAQWTRLTTLQPDIADAHLNRAIAAADAGQPQVAITATDEGLKRFPGHPRLLATRAMALKNVGRIEESVAAFATAVAADPSRPLTRHNQAVALRAAGRFEQACAAFAEGERLGLRGARFDANWAAAALEAGQVDRAQSLYRRALADDPAHEESLKALTRLHVEYQTGGDPFGHYETLARSSADSTDDWLRWISALLVHKQYDQAALAAADGFAKRPADARMEVASLFSTGMAGDAVGPLTRLQQIYERNPDDENLWGMLPQLALRAGRPELAAGPSEKMVARYPHHQTAWSILGVAWRLMNDPREHWLCDYDTLIMQVEIPSPDGALSPGDYALQVADALRPLHTTLDAPGDQSLRQGTQTAGALFDNPDPAIQRFRQAVVDSAARAIALLPEDRGHPFLSRKALTFGFSGSWSVRLRAGGGHHIPHFHSEGWMSSAYYARLPDRSDDAGPHDGWIEFGRPPPIFNLDLAPRRLVEPKEGRLVLFPSYLWHGTLPFGAGERLTAAFDFQPVVTKA